MWSMPERRFMFFITFFEWSIWDTIVIFVFISFVITNISFVYRIYRRNIYIYIYIYIYIEKFIYLYTYFHILYCRKSSIIFEYILNLKDKDKNFTITWSIAQTASPYTLETRWCNLCLTEKLPLAKSDTKALLKSDQKLIGGFAIALKTQWDVYGKCLNTIAIS